MGFSHPGECGFSAVPRRDPFGESHASSETGEKSAYPKRFVRLSSAATSYPDGSFPPEEDPPDKRGTRKDPALEFGQASAPSLNGGNPRRSLVLSYVREGFPVEAEGGPYNTVRSHRGFSAWREQDGSPP